jgi:hypothetical protein
MKRLWLRIRHANAAIRALGARTIVESCEWYGADAVSRARAYSNEADAYIALRRVREEMRNG